MEKVKKTIMVTWDFSAVSYYALKHAIRMSQIVKYDIMLFHIVNDPSEVEAAREKLEKTVVEIKNDLGAEVGNYVHHGKIFKEIGDRYGTALALGGVAWNLAWGRREARLTEGPKISNSCWP